jgi:SAM-dependent methyltransferase
VTEGAAGDWWEEFFVGPWLDVHSEVVPESRTGEDLETIERYLGVDAAGRVLDVPCGDGRLAIELAHRGYRVTGVDLSETLLERARSTAAARSVTLDLERRDMRDLPWRGAFDGVLCFWGSLGYFDDEGNAAFLDAVRTALVPGGTFLLQTHLLETLLPRFQEQGWTKIGATFLLEQRRFDVPTGRVETEWTFVGRGKPAVSRSSIRVYSFAELALLLKRAGFGTVEALDTETGEPPELPIRGRRILIRARSA